MAHVCFRVGDRVERVPAGAIIGRLASADLRLDDPRVSEAHALVSLRSQSLRLLALRRWFEVDGERSSDVELKVGQRVRLAPHVMLTVEEVVIDAPSLAVAVAGRVVELRESVYSLVAGEPTRIVEGTLKGADGEIWSTGSGWRARLGGEVAELAAGESLTLVNEEIEVLALPDLYAGSTAGAAGHLEPPVRVVLRHDTVHLFRPDRPPVVLSGMAARIVSEVGSLGAPAPWEVPAREIWRTGASHIRRQNWDRNLRRLRSKLAGWGVRRDLVRADGHGNVELYLLPGDELVDEM